MREGFLERYITSLEEELALRIEYEDALGVIVRMSKGILACKETPMCPGCECELDYILEVATEALEEEVLINEI